MNEDRFERLARSSFDHLSAGAGQRQSRAEGHHLVAEPCRRICVRDAGGCLAGSIIKPMVESMGLSWQQGPLSTGAIGRFLVPEPLPKRPLYVERLRRRMRVRFGGDLDRR
jgi:hypothetical protein